MLMAKLGALALYGGGLLTPHGAVSVSVIRFSISNKQCMVNFTEWQQLRYNIYTLGQFINKY